VRNCIWHMHCILDNALLYMLHWAVSTNRSQTLTLTPTFSQPCISRLHSEIHRTSYQHCAVGRHIDTKARSRDLSNIAWLQQIRLHCGYKLSVALYITLFIKYKSTDKSLYTIYKLCDSVVPCILHWYLELTQLTDQSVSLFCIYVLSVRLTQLCSVCINRFAWNVISCWTVFCYPAVCSAAGYK